MSEGARTLLLLVLAAWVPVSIIWIWVLRLEVHDLKIRVRQLMHQLPPWKNQPPT